jgi:type VI protein secretion system component VasF
MTASEQGLQAEIEQTRAKLGETVQQLAAKADVKSRARAKAADVTGRLKDRRRIPGQLVVPLGAALVALTVGYVAVRRWQKR